jgi:alpha-tubulin suppressor-like RCC1 family protein
MSIRRGCSIVLSLVIVLSMVMPAAAHPNISEEDGVTRHVQQVVANTSNAAAGFGSTSLLVDGSVYILGGNANGQLGNGTIGGSSGVFVQVLTDEDTPLAGITRIYQNSGTMYAWSESEGKLYGWGRAFGGKLGILGGTGAAPADVPYAAELKFQGGKTLAELGIEFDGSHAQTLGGIAGQNASMPSTILAIAKDGKVYSWGSSGSANPAVNDYRLGRDISSDPGLVMMNGFASSVLPGQVVFNPDNPDERAIAVAGTDDVPSVNYILSETGTLYAFGKGLTTSADPEFVKVEHPDKADGRKFVKMSVSSGGIVILLDDQGAVYTAFNSGDANHVYDASARTASRPAAVYGDGSTGGINGNAAAGITFKDVYAFGPTTNHVLFAVADDGTVYQWGNAAANVHGVRFGDGTAVQKMVTVAVRNPFLSGADSMSMYRTTAAAIKDNLIYTWGYNAGVDQLGNGSGLGQTASQGTPKPINEAALANVPALAAHANDAAPLVVSFSPAPGEVGVAQDVAPRITFNKIMRLAAGSTLADTVKVYEGTDQSGTPLPGGAYSVTNTGKTLTITFADALAKDTDYYIELQGGTLEDFAGTAAAAQGASFRTEGELAAVPIPDHQAADVSVKVKPAVSFSEAVTNLVALDAAVELREGSADGPLVPAAAAMEKNNTVVRLFPESELAYDTEYAIVLKANAFEDQDHVSYPKNDVVFTFTTRAEPAVSSFIKQVVSFSGSDADGNATALLTTDGKVYVNGNNANGIYADGTIAMPGGGLTGVFRPAYTAEGIELSGIDRIYTTQGNLLFAWDEDAGKMYAWGKNGFERSGIPNSALSVLWAAESTFHGTPIEFAGGARSITASVGTTYVIDKDGAVWSWGQASAANTGSEANGWRNDYRLGRDIPGIPVGDGILRPVWEAQASNGIKYLDAGKAWYSTKPGKVPFSSDPNEKAVEIVGAGTTSAFILTNYGNIYAFGGTMTNQFSSDPSNRFVKVTHPDADRKFVEISASVNGTAIMLDDIGQVYTMFANTFTNNKAALNPQKAIAIYDPANGIPNAESIIFEKILAFGSGASVAYLVQASDGKVYVWGSNQDAKLGLGIEDVGSGSGIEYAVENPALEGVEGFAGFNSIGAAWKDDIIYTWGFNPYNTLANGTDIASYGYSPLPVTKPYLVNIPDLQESAPDGDPPSAPETDLEGTNANFVFKPAVSQHLNDNVLISNFFGWGGQYNHQLYSDLNRTVYGATDANLENLKSKLINLGPSYTRIFYDPDPQRALPYINTAAGGNTGYTALYADLNRESLERTIRLAKETNTMVNLTYWHPAAEVNGEVVAAGTLDWDISTGMARFANYVKTLIVDKGLTNIKTLTIYNEPNDDTPLPMDQYVAVYKALDAALKNEGIRDRVQIVGGDLLTGNQSAWFKMMGEQLNDVVDIYSIHRYWFDGSNRYNMLLTVQAIINALPEHQRKPVQITEFGPNKGYMNPSYGGSEANMIKYAYETAGFNIMSASLGFDGTSKWDIFHAKYDGDIQDHSMILDARTGYELRPEYWAFLLLNMTSDYGWRSVKVRGGDGDGGSDNKIAAALESADGEEQSIYLLNLSRTETADISIEGLDTSKTYYVYMWNENGDGKITAKGALASSGAASAQSSNADGGVYKVTGISGNSFAVLTTRLLDPAQWADVWEYDDTPDVFITPADGSDEVPLQADVEIRFNVEFLNREGFGDINKIVPTGTPQFLEGPEFAGIVKVYEGTDSSGTELVEGTDFTVKFKTGVGYTYKDKRLVVSFPNGLKPGTDYYVEVQPNVLRHVRPDPTPIPYSYVNTKPVGSTFRTEQPDQAAPVTTAEVSGTAGTGGWYTSDVTVTLTAADDGSGIASTEYALTVMEGGDGTSSTDGFVPYTEPIVLGEGIFELRFRSMDLAGNVEEVRTLTVKSDQTAPTVRAAVDGEPLADGAAAFEDSVSMVLDLLAEDSLSGIAELSATVDGEEYSPGSVLRWAGRLGDHVVVVAAADEAGNVGVETITITVSTSGESMQQLLARFIADGEVNGPLQNQLSNCLTQALDHLAKGHYVQAAKHMQDFLKHIDKAKETYISDYAEQVLTIDANALIALWSQS